MTGAVILFAAGSLQAPLSDLARDFERETGTPVATTFAPSGLLRGRIENDEPAHVFASADMGHPAALASAGLGGPVRPFARNGLCVLTRAGLKFRPEDLLEILLRPDIRVGTSTPKADPSGDYAWALFEKAESVRPGAFRALSGKALQLTGGPASARPPAGRNAYAWIMGGGQADVFLTYRTNALLARAEVAGLGIVDVPPALSVGAEYGLTVLAGAPPEAEALAARILSPAGAGVLETYGFGAP